MANLVQLRSAVFATMLKVAEKNYVRDDLVDGESHKVNATISGTVDGRAFSLDVDSSLTVGHGTERKNKVSPSSDTMLAFVLESIGPKAAAKAIAAMQAEYLKTNSLIASDASAIAVAAIKTAMTTTEVSKVRGNVGVVNKEKEIEVKISGRKVG